MTRARRDPDHRALDAGIEHARHAIALDHELAEAHATLSFLLVAAGASGEARTAAERAVALEPDSWRHQYRLGHAGWGSARLRAFDRAVAIYPRFPYAHFEASMVHVARGHLEAAADIARQQVAWQDREAKSGHRFPAVGFHWMSGAIAAAGGRHDEALAHFDRELAQVDPRRLYGPEYGALALVGRGQIELAMDGAAAALASFRDARVHVPGHGRAYLGEAVALSRLGEARAAEAAWQEVAAAERDETRGGPRPDAHYLAACADAMRGDAHRAVGHLDRLLDSSAPGFSGWTIPLEPFLRPLGGDAGFQHILDELAARAL
jgi:tetratricopeptide (TPR) repeat protein